MEYNFKYINLQYALINCFLFKVDKKVLDISYSINEKEITIQIVLLEKFSFPQEKIDTLKDRLVGLDVIITEIYLTKEQFNENKGEWSPKYYKWLDYLLFSKAEVL